MAASVGRNALALHEDLDGSAGGEVVNRRWRWRKRGGGALAPPPPSFWEAVEQRRGDYKEKARARRVTVEF